MIRLLTLIFIFLLTYSCIQKGDGEASGQAAQDITISLLKISPPTVSITPNSTTQLSAVGGNAPYVFSLDSGFGSVDPTTGLYTASNSIGNNTVKVTDAGGNSAYAVIVVGTNLQITPTTTTMGTSKNFTFTAIGGVAPYSYSLISGLGSVDANTGVYTSAATSGVAIVQVTDSDQQTSRSTITIVDALTITPTTLTIEDLATHNFSVAGGAAPYSYSIYAGTGTIDANGLYTAPSTEGTTIVRVTDGNSNYAESNITIRKGPNLSATQTNIAPEQISTITSSEGSAPLVYSIISGTGSVDSNTGVFTAPTIADSTVIRSIDANGFIDDITVQTFNLKQISMGNNFVCANHINSTNNGSDYKCWGERSGASLGDGNSLVGDAINEMGDNLSHVDLGTVANPVGIFSSLYGHKCALFSNNKMKCWGSGSNGRLGNGDQTHRGGYSSQMGNILPFSSLGDGVTVATNLSIENRISAGSYGTCVDTTSGLKCFGEGAHGRLGYGNQTDYCSTLGSCGNALPSVDLGAGKSLVQISAGHEFSCVLIAPDNKVKCFGRSNYGQLGYENGSTITQKPKDIPFVDLGAGRTVQQISTGFFHTCALLDNNTVKCWGRNNSGQLGLELGTSAVIGKSANQMGDNLPAIDLGSVSFPTGIYVKGYRSCATFNNGGLKCWGVNSNGQLGIGNTSQKGDSVNEMGDNLPFVDLGPGETVSSIALSNLTTCVITNLNNLKCWGNNSSGQLGYENTTRIGDNSGEMGASLQSVNLGAGKFATMVAVSDQSTCALLNDNKIKCWGADQSGSLGSGQMSYGDEPSETVATQVNVDFGTGRFVKSTFSGRNHTCVILDNDETKCFGIGANGRLGYGNTANIGDSSNEMGDNLPAVDLGSGLVAKQIAGWENHTCAVLSSNDLKCWGDGANGRRGSNNQTDRGDGANEMGDNLSTVDFGAGRTAKEVTAGNGFSCVIMDNDQVKCFGYNGHGRLALGDSAQRGHNGASGTATYGSVNLGAGRSAKQISAGHEHWCALLDNGNIKCWGRSNYGQTGYNTTGNIGDQLAETGDSLQAVDLGTGRTAKQIATGIYHTCALLDNDKIKCWGYAGYGQLGNGSSAHRGDGASEMGDNLPYVKLGSTDRPLKVYAAGYSTCAVMDNNDVKCWGNNGTGQLGQGHRFSIGLDILSMGDNLPVTY
mgnify:CR=1 FL=1